MKKVYSILILLSMVLSATAGSINYPEKITYSFKAERVGNSLHIDIDVLLGESRIPAQGMLVLTPAIITKDQAVYHLPPAVVAGSKRYKAIERLLAYDNPVFEQTPQVLVKRKHSSSQTLKLSYSIPYEEWAEGADMYIYGDASGCADCGNVQDKKLVKNDIIPSKPSVFMPEYHVSYIVPEAEIKERSETFVARINYVVNRYELLPDFKNNASVLREVDALVKELQNDPDLTITRHTVTGYSSPEGNFNGNLTLSQNRAKSFMTYLQQRYNWNTANISYEGKGEDWDGLEAILNTSTIPYRNEIISIIDNTPDITRRKRALESFNGGNVYKMLLNEVYPSLRRNEFKVSYIARAFNVDEARRMIRTRPQLLNLNEMFLVANSYPKDSKEFKEVFDVAVRMFPDNHISKVNAAATDIEAGSAERAIEHLSGIDIPEAWNNLGVAYAQRGDFKRARKYFQQAIQAKNADASHNLDQLNKKEQSQR
ncbi:outer membrane protein OmpA-like peptidoglycan-associated protein [Parabacteroides sp. PF5-5]|uniref:tetratricopeptide repeat protein n=1 Tax=unclassified Parabacteroides TaxID=2649774 RepID=UPI002473C417|nr:MULTISPECIES: DUF3868 domain-containing protein [unclassified Parabacteroides]MDH6306486.1 outer membrane protein OmpA-like peptidoglycan-associated protein [Parabacteroides sp. PH5-39]MDH6317453.1 outer membrane protein OmpA-like peptidoglycan-associated protein [Parabacteroides sp. PF5-13]MDH6321244.1 outer membrane protein OmpA-like peptidoglycan-associated protein [Parabacteroides sp. PH5-13]MDH6324976.1 outer membrane protein OmpA-like peptidoglycan-associated protein [Parabacteroides s